MAAPCDLKTANRAPHAWMTTRNVLERFCVAPNRIRTVPMEMQVRLARIPHTINALMRRAV
jgi:hypothetical protein